MATNCLGPQLLTHMLAPLLIQTARNQASQRDSVRVVWVSSMINSGSTMGGIAWDEALNKPKILPGGMDQYMQAKVGDVFLAHKWGERLAGDGVVSVVSPIRLRFNTRFCAGQHLSSYRAYTPDS